MKHRGLKKVLVFGVVFLMIFVIFVGVPGNVGAEEPDFPEEPPELWKEEDNGWWVDGNDTYFEITNSSYLNISLTSSENVYVHLESVPNMISFHIEANCTATSTNITITGFEANKKYYRYQDSDLQEEFTTNETGSYSYTQDISTNCHVLIQETTSTLYIYESTTLTNNIYESIYIMANNIILDGAGFTVQGSGSGNGIYMSGRSGITIKNVVVSGFSYGIYLHSSINNAISGSTVSSNRYGIYLGSSGSNTISGSTVSRNRWGFYLSGSGSSIISGNTLSRNLYGIFMSGSISCIISGNTISGKSAGYGIQMYFSDGSIISENTISNTMYGGINMFSSCCTIIGNTISDNGGGGGIYLSTSDSHSNTVNGNTVSSNRYGIRLSHSNSNTINGNMVSGNNQHGIYLQYSSSNTINGNMVSGNVNYGIYIGGSSNCIISGNTVSGNGYGIYLSWSSSTTIFHNNFIDNAIQVYDDIPAANDWHDPILLEGNYWSDYTGVDDGTGTDKHAIAGDGIGDTEIPYPAINYDFYPFTAVNGWLNVPPVIDTIIGPLDPITIGTSFIVTGTFTDPDAGDTHTAEWAWGDESTSAGIVNDETDTVTGTHTYSSTGVYTILLTVTDSYDESDTMDYQYVVVYDPEGGFVTGGGWIDSPEGAYSADSTLTGKANFGFVSKYKKGATTPMGNTEFQFHAGDLNFHSDSYEWLVVAGEKAKFKGTGTINGQGSYNFMISAIDGDKNNDGYDKFRIKIWEEDEEENEYVIYDNNMNADDDADPTTVISGGEIMVHTPKK